MNSNKHDNTSIFRFCHQNQVGGHVVNKFPSNDYPSTIYNGRMIRRNKSTFLSPEDDNNSNNNHDDFHESEEQPHELQWSLDRSVRETRLSEKDVKKV